MITIYAAISGGMEINMGIIKLDSSFISSANIVGRKEFEGPLGDKFDEHSDDDYFSSKTFEEAESQMQRRAFESAIKKSGLKNKDIGAIFAGDLQNQCVASSYGLLYASVPFFGIYGACSTSAEGILLASIFTSFGVYKRCAAVTSSHNSAAERQYRNPLEYGGQRAPTAQWTVTGAAAFIIGKSGAGSVRIVEGLPGIVIDKGVSDASNMGSAMAPAACDTLSRYFRESGKRPLDFDLILTGDLGHEGSSILCELMEYEGYELKNHNDCGRLIYSTSEQDTHSGGSGCGCAASVLSAHILPEIEKGNLRNVLFVATGAMMSPDSIKQGKSIPSIAHLLYFSGGGHDS